MQRGYLKGDAAVQSAFLQLCDYLPGEVHAPPFGLERPRLLSRALAETRLIASSHRRSCR
jgi:hypothetical protein